MWDVLPAGTAAVKAEFLISTNAAGPAPDDDAAEGKSRPHEGSSVPEGDARDRRSSGPSRRMTKEQKKAQRGANKGRRFQKVRDELDLCYKVANGSTCEFGEGCRFTHDIPTYLAAKPPDLRLPQVSELLASGLPAAVKAPEDGVIASSDSSIDLTTTCPNFAELGECKYGFKCRFLGGHIKQDDSGAMSLTVDEDIKARAVTTMAEMNSISPETQKFLRSKKYQFPIANAYLQELRDNDAGPNQKKPAESVVVAEPEQEMEMEDGTASSNPVVVEQVIAQRTGEVAPTSQLDTPDVPTRFSEKRRLDWAGKSYLAPLTTVGNLPFRRLCVKYGADITCGEMGLATSFLAGSKEEWSLVRRHPSETTFGVQVAGNKPNVLVPTAEVIAKEIGGDIDFVDVNCGCPIDLVFNNGSGSALLDAPGKLGKILIGMNKALGEIPVTVKLRTGIKDSKNTAHNLMPRLGPEFNAGAMTLHGRTRQQRYTKLADWDYIKFCVDAVRAREADEDLPRIPIFGGGDCYSSQDYWSCTEQSGVDGVMVARGALIKPWIFTEIKEHREWDISARERLDLIGQYAEYGLSHFGTDTAGVNVTRRYLCEALSFQYRYVPIGLLEQLPGRINDRAPAFRGRDELETLLASGDSQDWVRISEMFLGPAPATWSFTPKHKSNAYESQG